MQSAAPSSCITAPLCIADRGVPKCRVVTEELAVLQEVGVYKYRHPLADAVQYQRRLEQIEAVIKEMAKKDGGAIRCGQNWTVDNSPTKGRAMVRDISKLMLRAYNAEADHLVRSLKPHKLDSAIERLNKVERAIEKLGKVMQIEIEDAYHRLRIEELALTADFLEKQTEEKEAERLGENGYARKRKSNRRSSGSARSWKRSADTMRTRFRR